MAENESLDGLARCVAGLVQSVLKLYLDDAHGQIDHAQPQGVELGGAR